MFLNLGHHSGHENSGCSFAFGQGAGGFAPACGTSGSRGPYTGRGRAAVRGGARNGQRVDGPLGARRESGAEGRASRTAALPALGSSSGSHHRAVDSEPVPGPVAFAVRAVDAGSGAAVAGPTVRRARVGLDGGALFAGLGSDATEAGAARLRTKPGRRGRWLKKEYPAIRAQAKREKAEIHWGDEMGLRSDHQAGRSYGRRGQTPVVPGTGQRFRCNLISAITNRGRLAFMVFHQRFTAPVFLNFLRRLLRLIPGKVFLILDRHPVHKSAPVSRWLAKHAARIQLFWLPSYSPELNPDELLNQDVKTNALGRVRPIDQQELMGNVRSYLRITQSRPQLVQHYFRERHVQYAAL